MGWEVEGQDGRGPGETSRRAVVTVVQGRDDSGGCDLSGGSTVGKRCHIQAT